jgi:RHS repeat-associated protein
VGDPCDVLTGDFSQTESDYSGPGLRFQRYYHSATLESNHTLGVGWTHNYAAYLVLTNGVPTGLLRPNGHHDALISTSTSGVYISLSGAAIHVQQSGTNWTATLKDGRSEIYNSAGQLIQLINPGGLITTLTYNSNNQLMSVSSPFGQALQFSYNTSNQLQQLIDPAGQFVTYGYGANNNLTSVTYQDATTRTYAYANSTFLNNLTGIVDESKNQFLTVQYDATTGAATSAQQAGGAQAVTLTYSANGAIAKDALGATHTYTFTSDANYAPRVTALSINSLNQTFAVPAGATDPQRRVTQSVDANGNIATYAYDANHLTSKTEASGSAVARTTSYQYLSTLSALPTLITEPLRQTSFTYYAGTNNVETKTVTDTTVTPNVVRTWTYTYDSYGRVLTAKGPRTDLNSTTTYAYYTCTTGSQCGQIETITNAVGQVTTFNTYNAYGQPLTITDPNGVVTTLTYDARQRVKSREIGTETTEYSYYPTGLLETVTLPDSSTITYAYDGAHRLTDITDSLGNHAHYTLDAMGNHTADNIYDPSATLRRTHTRVINALNELYQDIDAADTPAVTTTFGYDNNGNQTSSDAPLSRNTTKAFDALNRLDEITDPKSGITKVTYNARDDVASIIDPRNFTTSYTHDGFDEVTKLASPDSGTSSNTYDSGGNLKTTTDARGAVGTYTYDALNRVTQLAYTDQTIKYTYDAGTNGKGHLTGASDANHSMSWSYDSHGRVTGKGQTVASITKSVGYSYTNADMTSLVTPSGQTITYGYTNHRISSISINGTTLLSGVTYFPFGPVSAWTWGNATPVSRTYNTDGQVSQITTAGDVFTFGYDNALRITSIVDTESYVALSPVGYDALDRLSSATNSGAAYGWTYDANGNTLTLSGPTATTSTPSTSSNRLISTAGALARTYSYDAAGNTASYTGFSFTFNQRGRMSSATTAAGATDYVYNALGQLIQKYGAGGTTLLVYDEAGHLLGEYSSTGALIQETVWMDDTPVGTLRPNGSAISIYYVHTDHLNSPLAITQPTTHALMWFWGIGGTGSPKQNPLNQGTFVYNLRYPGQYYQAETGLYYNYFRDYDPQTGRYLESDPIGLRAGVNTYTYVHENPINNTDPLGLWSTAAHNAIIQAAFQGLSPNLIQAIEDGSASSDAFIYQLFGDPAVHAMSYPGEDPSAARDRACSAIADRLARYQQMADSSEASVQYMAYFELGEAMHTVMDSTSPAHAGFQPWSILDAGGHGDLPNSIEDLAHLTPELLNATVNKMNGVMKGQSCGCLL